jgi:TPR repeat protein
MLVGLRHSFFTGLAGGVLAFALCGTAMAGALEDSRAAYQRGDYATAMALLRPLAEGGDAAAQNGLGLMYAKGQGVPQDYAQALVWYRKAADQGNAAAQNGLGLMYAKPRRAAGLCAGRRMVSQGRRPGPS